MKHKILLFGLSFILMTLTVYASGDKPVSDTNRITISPLFFGPPTHEYPFEEEMTEEKLSRILDNMNIDGIETVLLVGNSDSTSKANGLSFSSNRYMAFKPLSWEIAFNRCLPLLWICNTPPSKWLNIFSIFFSPIVRNHPQKSYGKGQHFRRLSCPASTGQNY